MFHILEVGIAADRRIPRHARSCSFPAPSQKGDPIRAAISVATFLLALVILGCGGGVGRPDQSAPPNVSLSNGTAALVDPETGVRSLSPDVSGTDTDWSGQVQIIINECVSPGFVGGSITQPCSVPTEYVLIGGGAQDVWTGQGALLWESRPFDSLTWFASSKDHLGDGALHQLHTWAVGLRLVKTDGTFMSRDELLTHVSYGVVTSPVGQRPSASCTVPVGQTVIGGGARSNWPATGGVGQLLIASYPSNTDTWFGQSKDHLQADPASLDTHCIGIDPVIPGVGTLVIDQVTATLFASGAVGTACNNVTNAPRSVAACYGGLATWNGSKGRMLFRMGPGDSDIRTFCTSSKDHLEADSGNTTAYLTQIRLQ